MPEKKAPEKSEKEEEMIELDDQQASQVKGGMFANTLMPNPVKEIQSPRDPASGQVIGKP